MRNMVVASRRIPSVRPFLIYLSNLASCFHRLRWGRGEKNVVLNYDTSGNKINGTVQKYNFQHRQQETSNNLQFLHLDTFFVLCIIFNVILHLKFISR